MKVMRKALCLQSLDTWLSCSAFEERSGDSDQWYPPEPMFTQAVSDVLQTNSMISMT